MLINNKYIMRDYVAGFKITIDNPVYYFKNVIDDPVKTFEVVTQFKGGTIIVPEEVFTFDSTMVTFDSTESTFDYDN